MTLMAEKKKQFSGQKLGDSEHPNMTDNPRYDAFNLGAELNGKGYHASYPADGSIIWLEPAAGNRIEAVDILVLAKSFGYAFNHKCELMQQGKLGNIFKVGLVLERISK